ncbi:LCP family glycopolymer transferase [Crossiella sp. NPDC003009]
MPDDHREGGYGSRSGRRRRAEDETPDLDQPSRRRRSLDDGGGTSVSDLLAKHGGTSDKLPRPAPPPAPQHDFAPPPMPPVPPMPPRDAAPPMPPRDAPPPMPPRSAPVRPPRAPMPPQGRPQEDLGQPSGGRMPPPMDQPSGGRMPPPADQPSGGRMPPPMDQPSGGRMPPPMDQPSGGRMPPPRDLGQPSGGRMPPPDNGGRMPPRDIAQPTGGRMPPPGDLAQPTGGRMPPPRDLGQPSGGRMPPPRPPRGRPQGGPPGAPQQGGPQQGGPQQGGPQGGPPPVDPPTGGGFAALDEPVAPAGGRPGPPQGGRPPRPPQGARPGNRPPAPPVPPTPPVQPAEPVDGEMDDKRRKIDATLSRFSAVHDEMAEIEEAERERRGKLTQFIRIGGKDKDKTDKPADKPDPAEQTQLVERPGSVDVPTMGVPYHELVDEDEDEPPREAAHASAPPADEDPDALRRRRLVLVGKALVVAVAAVVLVATGIGWAGKQWINGQIREVSALDPNSDQIQDKDKQYGAENFLMIGSDTRAGATAEDGVGDEKISGGARADTVMVAHVPADRKRVVIMSFPRDMDVTIPACEGWDAKTGKYTGKTEPARKNQKLNAAYAVGGPKCITKLVLQLSGLNINHFVGIDFHGFKAMVNAVKGVEVCVPKPLIDEELGAVITQTGRQTISGDTALSYVRIRKVKGQAQSDYERIERQQRFLSSLLRKVMSQQVLTSPTQLQDFVKAFASSTYGENIGIDQMLTLGTSLQGLEAGRVTFVQVPVRTVELAPKKYREEFREKDAKALFQAIINGTPLPQEKPAGGAANQNPMPQAQNNPPVDLSPAALVDPKTVKIQVLNGSDKAGNAAKAVTGLEGLGFSVVKKGTSPAPSNKTVIRFADERRDAARTLAAAVPGATLTPDPSMGGAIQLILGPEFDGKVVKPSGGGGGTSTPGQTPTSKLPGDLSTVNGADNSCT